MQQHPSPDHPDDAPERAKKRLERTQLLTEVRRGLHDHLLLGRKDGDDIRKRDLGSLLALQRTKRQTKWSLMGVLTNVITWYKIGTD